MKNCYLIHSEEPTEHEKVIIRIVSDFVKSLNIDIEDFYIKEVSKEIRDRIAESAFCIFIFSTHVPMAWFQLGMVCALDKLNILICPETFQKLSMMAVESHVIKYDETVHLNETQISKYIYDALQDVISEVALHEKTKMSSDVSLQTYLVDLWVKGNAAQEKREFRTAAEYWQKITSLNPLDARALYKWGNALLALSSDCTQDQSLKLLKKACALYENSVKLSDQQYDAFNNWGITLCRIAKSANLNEADKLLSEAIEKYKLAIKIKPDFCDALYNWADALVKRAEYMSDDEAVQMYIQAFELFEKRWDIQPSNKKSMEAWRDMFMGCISRLDPDGRYERNYVMAKIYAKVSDFDECKYRLLQCEKKGALPTYLDASSDKDFTRICEETWFKNLRWQDIKNSSK